MLGVLTWGASMPDGFPISHAQNSGNMVHAQVPFKLFPNAVGPDFGYREEGFSSFTEFVNEKCTALVVPFANSIRNSDKARDEKKFSLIRSLERYEVPIIPFGLGAQAPSLDIDEFELGPGNQAFIRFLNDRAPAVSVRGDFTYQVFEKYGSVDNVFVTGCPSFFSHPEAFQQLHDRLELGGDFARAAFSGSLHHVQLPKQQLYRAIEQDMYLIEPVSKNFHQFYLDCINDVEGIEPAYFLKALLKEPDWSVGRLKSFMIRRYQLFRDLNSWLAFNREAIDGTIGTRFHVNMASLLSGIPAVWIAHDSRTYELCRQLSLPYVSAEESLEVPYRDLLAHVDYDPMFQALPNNFSRFNEFLRAASLPEVEVPSVVPSR